MKYDELFIEHRPAKDSVVVRYLITTKLDFQEATIKLCKEQSLSPALGKDVQIIKNFSAKYIPNSIKTIKRNQFIVDIVFPPQNIEESLSMVLSAAGGDVYNIKNLYPIKILSIHIPNSIIRKYGGPKYGVEGIRKLLGIYNRPILLGPVKPCVGMRPEAFAQRAKEALLGGADIVKDDELICNPSYNPLAVRVKMMAEVVKEAQRLTGERKMYFAFIGGGSPSEIMNYAKVAKQNDANGFMVGPAINGFEIIKDLKVFGLPVIAHNNYTYSAYTENHGVSFSVFALFQRICGADIVITPGKYGTFDVMTKEDHQENIKILLDEIDGIKRTFPAFAGGQSSKTIPLLKKDAGGNDFIITAGTVLYDHPDGPTAGAQVLRESFTN